MIALRSLVRSAAAHCRVLASPCAARIVHSRAACGLLATGTTSLAAAAMAASVPVVALAEAPNRPAKVLCLHGINLNMFGKRDPGTYGFATLDDINMQLHEVAHELGLEIECFQTNYEGELVEKIHAAHVSGEYGAVLINAGAWTHYSYGLRDALAILSIPVVEVHMSNIHAREDMAGSQGEQMRHHSVVSPLAKGIVAGFGLESYLLGLRAAAHLLGSVRPAAWYTDNKLMNKKRASKDVMPFLEQKVSTGGA